MGFIDERDHLASGGVKLDELFLEAAHQLVRRRPGRLEPQVARDRSEHFVAREARHRQVDRFDRLRQALDQHAAKHRLAAAHFTRDLDEALARGDRVEQALERRAAVGAREEELRVGGDAKGRFAKAEMLEVHGH